MIKGIVNFPEARIRVEVEGRRGSRRKINAIIDTGYSGSLLLPPTIIAGLGLRWKGYDRAILADGSECVFDMYAGKVLWEGRVRGIVVDEADSDPLVGMDLLKGHELIMQIRSRGKVTIKPLPKE
jgi:clan AA aspartic protease